MPIVELELWRMSKESSEAASRQTETEENEMYGLVEYEVSRQHREETRQEVALARLARVARTDRERRPYVVRDLSWEFARYLDKEGFSASAPATSTGRSGHHGRAREEERVAG